jgi:uncharacterized protein YutE (UPF0331/DUF86 family)
MNDVVLLERADRLHAITQRVGYALWQLQELEGIAAQCFVLLAQATKGMGEDAGSTLLDKALSGTFGAIIRKLREAGVLPAEMESQLQGLLKERNWLVHSSRAASRDAVHNDVALSKATQRIDQISDDALAAMRNLGAMAQDFVKKHGVTEAQIDRNAAELLKRWHGGDAL